MLRLRAEALAASSASGLAEEARRESLCGKTFKSRGRGVLRRAPFPGRHQAFVDGLEHFEDQVRRLSRHAHLAHGHFHQHPRKVRVAQGWFADGFADDRRGLVIGKIPMAPPKMPIFWSGGMLIKKFSMKYAARMYSAFRPAIALSFCSRLCKPAMGPVPEACSAPRLLRTTVCVTPASSSAAASASLTVSCSAR